MRALLLTTLCCLPTQALAQTWTFPLNPQATFYRLNQDTAQPPLIVDLQQLGISPGQWLRLESSGGFRYISGGLDDHRSLTGVFGGSAVLLASNLQQRVPDAIAAGPAFVSGGTYHGNLPMDIAQDFFASRNTWGNGVVVQVPPGATHLFVGIHDSLYNDNVDPNGDYGAVLTLLPAPALPGTGEHLTLWSGVDAPATATPDSKPAPVGSTLTAELHHPVGFLDGALYLYVADIMPTGGVPPTILPRLWCSSILIVQFGVVSSTPDWTDTWSLTAPAGHFGTSLIVQVGALSPLARNGLYETTDAQRFDLQ